MTVKHRSINKIYSKSFRNAIGIGARAFRCDFEGWVFYEGGVKDGGTQPTITPLINGPPTKVIYKGGVGGGLLLGGRLTRPRRPRTSAGARARPVRDRSKSAPAGLCACLVCSPPPLHRAASISRMRSRARSTFFYTRMSRVDEPRLAAPLLHDPGVSMRAPASPSSAHTDISNKCFELAICTSYRTQVSLKLIHNTTTVSFQNIMFVLRPRPWQFEI